MTTDKFEVIGDGEQAESHSTFYCTAQDVTDLSFAVAEALKLPAVKMQRHRFIRLTNLQKALRGKY